MLLKQQSQKKFSDELPPTLDSKKKTVNTSVRTPCSFRENIPIKEIKNTIYHNYVPLKKQSIPKMTFTYHSAKEWTENEPIKRVE